MELNELIAGAQEAMDGGDFRLALTANTHALKAYPACLAAHRIMGEAYLERGDQASAVTHFERTLQMDPLNVIARLGLGVAAEETKNFQAAYAHYLHAWEINPALDQVRDELVRLRGLLNVDERLHPTRAGLAGIHARAGQFRRAIGEWRAVLAIEPESRRGRTALAELLWRGGDDAGAAQAAREALRGSPDNARALAILADVERRRNGAGAEEIAQRYAQVDPTGDMIGILQPWRIDADLSFLKVDSAPLDEFDFNANRSRETGPLGARKTVTASLTSSHLGAPDLWDTLIKDLATDLPSTSLAPTEASGVEPFSWSDNGPPPDRAPVLQPSAMIDLADRVFGAGETPSPDPLDTAEDAVSIELSTEFQSADEVAEDIEVDAAVASAAFGLTAMNPDTFDDLIRAMTDEEPAEDSQVATDVAVGMATSSNESVSSARSAPVYASTVAPVVSPSRSTPFDELLPGSDTGIGGSAVTGPRVTSNGAGDRGADFVDPFVTADGQIDLTQGWDDLDRALADATPSFAGDDDFDALLADLDGILPFDAVSEGGDDDAWAPLSDDDFATEPVASPPSAGASGPVDLDAALEAGSAAWIDDLTSDATSLDLPAEEEIQPPGAIDTYPSVIVPVVETNEPKDATGELLDFADLEAFDVSPFLTEAEAPAIEAEIVTGIPGAQPSGYTELLRNVDEESLAAPVEPIAEVDPFAIPDGSGQPLDFDELLEVTSSDGTGPLAALESDDDVVAEVAPVNPFDFAATDLEAALPPALAAELELELDGIVPFDSAVFAEDRSDDEPVEFGEIDDAAADVVLEAVVEFDAGVEPFAPEIPPFGYTDALSALDEEPFDFSDVVVETVSDMKDVPAIDEVLGEPELEPAAGEADAIAADTSEQPEAELAEFEPEQPAWAGKEGLGTVARKVLWPKFVNQTSELIDRALETEDLFERITAQKVAMTAQGMITNRRRLTAPAEVAAGSVLVAEVSEAPAGAAPVPAARRVAPEMSEQTRLDLMAMRIRVIEDEDAAPEIAEALERALAEGLSAPLALRVLGEAYLKMGLVERAAAQFRQAMLARRRISQEGR